MRVGRTLCWDLRHCPHDQCRSCSGESRRTRRSALDQRDCSLTLPPPASSVKSVASPGWNLLFHLPSSKAPHKIPKINTVHGFHLGRAGLCPFISTHHDIPAFHLCIPVMGPGRRRQALHPGLVGQMGTRLFECWGLNRRLPGGGTIHGTEEETLGLKG